jgi:hypothetical protein
MSNQEATHYSQFSVIPNDAIVLILSYLKINKADVESHLLAAHKLSRGTGDSSSYIIKLLFGYSGEDPTRTPFQLYTAISFGSHKKLNVIQDLTTNKFALLSPILATCDIVRLKKVSFSQRHLDALKEANRVKDLRIMFNTHQKLRICDTLSKCTSLRKLGLSRIYASELPTLLSNLLNLYSLNVSLFSDDGPALPPPVPIDFAAFKNATELKVLRIYCNFKLPRNNVANHLLNLSCLFEGELKKLTFSMYMDATSLMAIQSNTTLQELELIDCTAVGDLGASYVANNTSLKSASLRNCSIGNVGAQSLFKNNTLLELDIRKNRVLAKGLKDIHLNKFLVTLNIENCKVGNQGATYISQNKRLKYLFVCACDISAQGAAQLLAACPNLWSLYLSHNKIEDAELVENLSKIEQELGGEQPSKLEILKIDSNDVGEQFAEWLSKRHERLNRIYVQNNPHIARGSRHLLSRTYNTDKPVKLNLEGCSITDEDLLSMQDNNKLEWLCLTRNNITDVGAAFLGKQTQLLRIFISQNQAITNQGMEQLVSNESLVMIWLENNPNIDREYILARLSPNIRSFRV